ncbi:hypothetical protein AK812_SmicGene40935 [Symbiodinium microadriaticum]|uniref:Reverse transcriptase domain-containing protein n=1 Tax=Symbiodinium microadriaticum TaxID=2951 RepID=A0A1Q9C7D9_SYMMI|nr:hypothetical protein AK812_SmicGene40935 [Symbiodinium microadriaticum]
MDRSRTPPPRSGGHGTATPQPPMTLPVPEDWLQDNDYLDTRRSIGNLSCPRHVVSSSWAREKGIAGIPVTNLHPAHFLYQGWNSVFRALGIVPGYPSFQQFSAESVLYLRFSPVKKHAKLFYVGSTEKSVMIREHCRYRKYKLVLEEKLVSAELSIRFWAHHRNFWNWCIIPVTDVVSHDLLRGREQALIQTLQPPLNFPFIARWFCPSRGIIKPPEDRPVTPVAKAPKKAVLRHRPPGPPRGLIEVFEQIWEKHLTQASFVIWHTEGTFGNPQVFQEVPRMFEEQIKKVQKAAKRDLQRRYPWAFRRTPVIPRAYALPKRKKDFASGRPIVSFVDAFMRPLLEATSRLLHRICSLAFTQAFSKGDVYELLNQVREFFQSGTTEKLHCRSQDLAGFFNSISQSQFLQAWRITLEFYRQRHGAQADTTFSVNLKEQAQQLRVFRGKRRTRASREVTIWCEDLPTIIRHALALQHFQVSTRNFRQCFGSPMGSPLSPALCGMVIAAQEEIWRRTFNISCPNMNRSLLSLRYVGNRLWLSESRFEQLPGIRLLLH